MENKHLAIYLYLWITSIAFSLEMMNDDALQPDIDWHDTLTWLNTSLEMN